MATLFHVRHAVAHRFSEDLAFMVNREDIMICLPAPNNGLTIGTTGWQSLILNGSYSRIPSYSNSLSHHLASQRSPCGRSTHGSSKGKRLENSTTCYPSISRQGRKIRKWSTPWL